MYLLFWLIIQCATAKSLQSCPTQCDPIDGSPPGSPVPGILQARTLEWLAISLSNAWKWKVKVKSLSFVSDPQRPHGLQPTRLLHPWDFPGKSTGMGCHCLLRTILCSKLVFSTLLTVNCWILIRCILISSVQKFWDGWIDHDFGYFVFVLQGTVFFKIVIELLGPTKMFCSSRKYFFCQTLRVLIVWTATCSCTSMV